MNNKSLWSFENPEEVSEYGLPKHNSKQFIDADFMNERLYIYEEGSQKGIQYFVHEKTQEALIKKNICNLLENSTNEKFDDFLRICFDFDNNVILVKLNDGLEKRYYYLNLVNLKQLILDSLDLENVSSEELKNEIEVLMILNKFESSSQEEKINFIKSIMEFKELVDLNPNYENTITNYIELLEEEKDMILKYFQLYLLGKISKSEAEQFVIKKSRKSS